MDDLTGKTPGSSLTSDEWNQVAQELLNIFDGAFGIDPDDLDLNQVGQGIANYVANGNAYSVGGTADAITLATIGSKQEPTAYLNGMGIGFVPTANNTGAVTVAVNTLGAVALVRADGTALTADDLVNGVALFASYRSGSNHFRIIGTSDNFAKSSVVTQQSFTVAGADTWNRPPGVKHIIVEMVGGGGGGGSSGTTDDRGGGGGGAGGYVKAALDVTAISSSALVVGAGGAAGSASNGGVGVGSSFTELGSVVAAGGGGGNRGGVNGAGGNGGLPSGSTPTGTILMRGGGGGAGSLSSALGGAGGNSAFGGAAPGRTGSNNGSAATNAGGGGGGGCISAGGENFGGIGAEGVILVTEYR